MCTYLPKIFRPVTRNTLIFYYAPAMTMAGALSFTPVRPYVCTSVQTTSAL